MRIPLNQDIRNEQAKGGIRRPAREREARAQRAWLRVGRVARATRHSARPAACAPPPSFPPTAPGVRARAAMSRKPVVAYYYDEMIGNYYYGAGNPMKPARVRMTHSLLGTCGLFSELEVFRPTRATQRDMSVFHADDYIEFLNVRGARAGGSHASGGAASPLPRPRAPRRARARTRSGRARGAARRLVAARVKMRSRFVRAGAHTRTRRHARRRSRSRQAGAPPSGCIRPLPHLSRPRWRAHRGSCLPLAPAPQSARTRAPRTTPRAGAPPRDARSARALGAHAWQARPRGIGWRGASQTRARGLQRRAPARTRLR